MMSSKNSGFTASDIDRYHSGKMSDQERHALEKAALDDPFLADALEGYTLTATPSADLSKLRSRLDEKLNRKRVLPFYQQYKWLSVAAILIILLGAGWLVYSISGNRNDSYASATGENQNPKESGQPKLPTSASADTGKTANTLNYSNGRGSTQPQPLSGTSQDNRNTTVSNSHKSFVKPNDDMPAKTDVASTLASNDTEKAEMATNNQVSSTEKNNETIKAKTAEPMANNNAQSNPKIAPPAKDQVATLPSISARANVLVAPDTIKNMNIVMHPIPEDSLGLKEVVVVGYGAKKKPLANVYHPQVTIDTLEPAEGYDSFDDYIATNLNVPEEYKTKAAKGEVQLSFDVDHNGQPVNITVVKSLCQKCDEEAVRLLKDGPKWKKKKDKKGKITITF